MPTLVRGLAERVDMRRLNDSGAPLDDPCGFAGVSLGVLVAGEVLTRTSADGFTSRIGNLRKASCQPLEDDAKNAWTYKVGGHRVNRSDCGGVGNARMNTDALIRVESGVEVVERHDVYVVMS